MNQNLKKIGLGFVSACLCMAISAFSALAATITPSESSITLQKGEKEFSFGIYLETEENFAGAEFGLLPSQSDVTFERIEFAESLQNESKVQTIKDGCLYFGFFSNANQFEAGKRLVATVYYTYSGTGDRTVSLKESKVVTIDAETSKTIGDVSAAPFTVSIIRTGSGSGGSGGGASSSGGGTTVAIGGSTEPADNPAIPVGPSETLKFTDISSHWAREEIEKAAGKGFFSGISETEFAPDEAVTRAMAVTVLCRFAGNPDVEANSPFLDVPAEAYYADAVAWATANGVVKGVSETEFDPNSFITREQMAAMLVRYLKASGVALPEATDQIDQFMDSSRISDYARDSLALCCDAKLITGHDSGYLEPQGKLTRAQFAAVIIRLDAYISNGQT